MVLKTAYEDATYGERKAGMARAKDAAMRACARERQRRDALGRNGRFRKRGSVHYEALAEAVRTEGPEVLSAAADGYWKDMERANPWMMIDGKPESGDSLNGHRNRHGKVSKRYIESKGWFEWRNGRWERMDRCKTLKSEEARKD